MQGRLEHELKRINLIEKKIDNYPSYMRDFYLSIKDKTYNTCYSYITTVCNFLDYLKGTGVDIQNLNSFKDLSENHIIEYSELHKYIRKKGELIEASESHRAREYFALKKFFRFLVKKKIIVDNPCNEMEAPKVNKKIAIVSLSPDEVTIIENNIKNGVGSDRAKARQKKWRKRDLAIVEIGFNSGLRVSAISEINAGDINFANNSIRVTEKGNIQKDIFLSNNSMIVIKEWLYERSKITNNNNGALFISNADGRRLEPTAIRSLLKKYTYNIQKNVTPHKMRSTFATTAYEETKDIYGVSTALGHSRVETTKRYVQVSEPRQREIASMVNRAYKGASIND